MEENLKKYIIYALFPLFALFFMFYAFLNSDFLKGNNIDEYSSDYCHINNSSLICKNKYKKNKFLWLIVDGNAYDQLVLLTNKTKYKIPIIFRGKGKGYKHTSQFFAEMFSGIPSQDMLYSEIKTDQIFKQLYKANYSMNFLGMNAPVNKLCGNESNTFKNKHIFKEYEKYSFHKLCNVSYPIDDSWSKNYYNSIINRDQRLSSKITKENVYSDLDFHFKKENVDILESINLTECFINHFFNFNENESIIYYNTELDKYNHLLTKEHIKTISEEYITENWIIKIMEWVDEHPDYALIVNSDHGGQKFYGEDDINNHGLDIEGNEAILFIYTKDLKDSYDKLKSDDIFYTKVDPSSIISQILENVNIPLQSQGIAYPIGNDSLFGYTAYKSKENQLLNQLNAYIEKYPNYERDLNEIINKINISKFNKINEEEYEQYFNSNFTQSAINFIKEIQEEITNILNNKNKFISSYIIICLGIAIIYMIFIILQIKDIFSIINEDEDNNIKLFIFILNISLFPIQSMIYFITNLSIFDRLVIGIFATPFLIIICNILIKYHYPKEKIYIMNILIFSFGIISIAFHYSKFFIFLKKYFSTIIKSRILKVFCLCPILFFELYYTNKQNFYKSNIFLFKFPIYYINMSIYITYIILIIAFDMSTENYFISHTPFNYILTISIYFLFIIMFVLAEYIIKNNSENNKEDKNQELIKNIFFLFEFFINDESNRLMMLIIYIMYEYLFVSLYNNRLKKINKIIISITIINTHEIFYLLVSRVYGYETSKIFFSKTIGYTMESVGLFNSILEVLYKLRFSVILAGFFLETNLFGSKLFNNKETFILKLILNIKCGLNFIFFSYNFIFLKDSSDFVVLFVHSCVDLSIFLFDFINQFIIYINFAIIKCITKRRKSTKLFVNI